MKDDPERLRLVQGTQKKNLDKNWVRLKVVVSLMFSAHPPSPQGLSRYRLNCVLISCLSKRTGVTPVQCLLSLPRPLRVRRIPQEGAPVNGSQLSAGGGSV